MRRINIFSNSFFAFTKACCHSVDSSVIDEEEAHAASSSVSSSFLSDSYNESEYTDDSSDDSDSIIAYKKRHAHGLNFNSYYNKAAKCNSHLNLSDLSGSNARKSPHLSQQASNEKTAKKVHSRDSLQIYQRLATSYYDNSPPTQHANNLKRIRFLSQKRMDFVQYDHEETHYLSQNFIF